MQFEAMLGAWKGMSYVERFCQSYDLGKIEDEEHLFFVYPNTQKVRNAFV